MRSIITALAALICTLAPVNAAALVWYVDSVGGDSSGDATSWQEAVPTLAEAAALAEAGGDQHPTFWITAAPLEGEVGADRVLNLAGYSFSSVSIFGGFISTETSPNDRMEGLRTTITAPAAGNTIGGILSNIPELVLDGLRFEGLGTDDQGAALYITAGDVDANDCVFAECAADAGGGAITLRLGSSLEASDCVFNDNTASGGGLSVPASGGDILLSSEPGELVSGMPPTATLTDCRLAGAGSATKGGSIYVGAGSVLTVSGSTIVSSITDERGGGIFAEGHPDTAVTLVESDVSNCQVFNGPGGGLWAGNGATVLLLDSRFANCIGTEAGGAWLQGCAGEITGTDFIGNATHNLAEEGPSDPRGGGVVMDDCALPIADCRFIGNRAGHASSTTSYGGGLSQVDTLNNQPLTVTNSLFEGNRSFYGNGGGIYSEFSQVTVDGCEFIGNSAEEGGGLRALTQGASVGIRETTFEGNNGGGAGLVSGEQLVTQCRFEANTASVQSPGGLISSGADSLQVINSLFADNADVDSSAIRIADVAQAPQIAYCTLVGHTQYQSFQTEGALIRMDQSSVTLDVTSCILDGPLTFATDTGDVSVEYSHALELPVDEPDWFTDGAGNVTGDPYFFDPQREDWRLTPSSPALDAANASSLPGEDLRGVERPMGEGPDMGAYELDTDTDSDRDGVSDLDEGTGDSDDDGVPDYLDPDNNMFLDGDLNNDGEVNAVDIQRVINITLGVARR